MRLDVSVNVPPLHSRSKVGRVPLETPWKSFGHTMLPSFKIEFVLAGVHDTNCLVVQRMSSGLKVKLVEVEPFPCDYWFAGARIADRYFLGARAQNTI